MFESCRAHTRCESGHRFAVTTVIRAGGLDPEHA
jgi:hypothetical protein